MLNVTRSLFPAAQSRSVVEVLCGSGLDSHKMIPFHTPPDPKSYRSNVRVYVWYRANAQTCPSRRQFAPMINYSTMY